MLVDFTVLDLETTKLDALTGRITEVAARRYRNGRLAAAWSTLVWGGQEPEPEAVALNGLTAERLQAEGLDETAVATGLVHFLGDSVLVAHNAAFELSWLNQTYLRLFSAGFANDFLCTKTLAAALGAGSGISYSLRQLTHDYNIELVNAHRAMPDVVATVALFSELKKLAFQKQVLVRPFINCCGVHKTKNYPLPEGLPGHVKTVLQ
jgi:DNA polymerase-3 subunit epsilon